MKLTKRLLATVMALALLLGVVPFAALAGEEILLSLDSTIEVSGLRENPAWLSFTPEETGVYVLYSAEGEDPQAELYVAGEEELLIYSDDEGEGMQFRLAYYMTAGTEYLYAVDNRDYETPFLVTLIRGIAPESVTINGVVGDSINIPFGGANTSFDATVYPENADTILEWSSGDDDIFTVDEGNLHLKRLGSTTLTVKAGNVTDTVTVNVVEPTHQWVIGEQEVLFEASDSGDYRVGTFTPVTTGRYRFIWEGQLRKYCEIFIYELYEDGQVDYLIESGSLLSGRCNVGEYMEEGHTYIIVLDYYGRHDNAMTTFTLGREVEATGMSFQEGTGVSVVYGMVTEFDLSPVFTPTLAIPQSYTSESSDASVAVMEYETVVVNGLGTATITTTSINELEATFEVNVIDKPALQMGTPYTFTSYAVTDGVLYHDEARYTFTPEEEGNHFLTFNSEEYIRAYLYEVDSETGYNVSIHNGKNWLNLQAGSTYELVVECTYTDPARHYSAQFELNKPASPTDVVWDCDTITLDMLEWAELGYVLSPDNADESVVTFETSDPSILNVEHDGTIRAVGVGTATVTVSIPNGKQDTVTVTVNPPLLWHGEKTETVITTPLKPDVVFELTVEEDGWYEIFSEGEYDPEIDLYVWGSQFGAEHVTSGGDELGENFRIVDYLEKDRIYYIMMNCDEELAQFPVTLRSCEEPEGEEDYDYPEIGVNIFKETMTVPVGTFFIPLYGVADNEWIDTIVSSDESIVKRSNYLYDDFVALAPGKATLTYTTDMGYTDTIEVTVTGDYPTLTQDQPVNIELSEEIIGRVYRFVPTANGKYAFYSERLDGDPYAYLFDANGDEIDYDDDRDDIAGLDFRLQEDLTAGKTYYLLCTAYNSEDLSYTVTATTAFDTTDYGVAVDPEDYLFVEDDVYYVAAGKDVDFDVVPIPYGATLSGWHLEAEGDVDAYGNWIECGEAGDVTVTVVVGDVPGTVISFRVVDIAYGDLNFDGDLDETDVKMLYGHLVGEEDLGRRVFLANMDDNGVIDADDLALLCELAGVENPGRAGDVNGDGKVDSTDARMVLQYAVGKIGEGQLTVSLADVNGDNKVDSTDARLILQFAVGKIKAFPSKK